LFHTESLGEPGSCDGEIERCGTSVNLRQMHRRERDPVRCCSIQIQLGIFVDVDGGFRPARKQFKLGEPDSGIALQDIMQIFLRVAARADGNISQF
jgi:hypothetical protein